MASEIIAPPSAALSDTQILSLRRAARIAAVIFLLLAGAKAVTSVLTFLSATLLALLGLIEGGLLVLLALILIKIATDLRFAREVPQLGSTHLLNAVDSWQDFCKFLIGLAVVAFLEAVLRYSA